MISFLKRNYLNIISLTGLLLIGIFIWYGYSIGIFTSEEKMAGFISNFGLLGSIVFILIQALQVVIPIIPASVTCGLAVLFWGDIKGFIFNYIGICLGSVVAFLLARRYGQRLVKKLIGEERYKRYENKFKNKFDKIFALLIFLPLAPDDFLVYFAGLTKMKFKNFLVVILLGKILGIAFYSMFLVKIFKLIGLA